MTATTATIPVRSDRISAGSPFPRPPPVHQLRKPILTEPWRTAPLQRRWRHASTRRSVVGPVHASSRADDSAPFEMSVENALKLLGVSEGASFDDILRAKNSIVASCKDDQETISQVEAAYDMLLMQRLTQRRAGKVVNSNVRYADVKRVQSQVNGSMPQWMQSTMKNSPVSIESPSTSDLGLQAGVYGALMGLTYISGSSMPPAGYAGADVPGLILAGSFGASLYFMTKKNVKLGKATVITIGAEMGELSVAARDFVRQFHPKWLVDREGSGAAGNMRFTPKVMAEHIRAARGKSSAVFHHSIGLAKAVFELSWTCLSYVVPCCYCGFLCKKKKKQK